MIKIIYLQKEKTFSEILEERARRLVGSLETKVWDASITSNIERQILITLNEIDSQRSIFNNAMNELMRDEFYTYRDLKTAKREAQYREYHHNPIEPLKRKLNEIEHEKRNLKFVNEEKIKILFNKLLMNVHNFEAVS